MKRLATVHGDDDAIVAAISMMMIDGYTSTNDQLGSIIGDWRRPIVICKSLGGSGRLFSERDLKNLRENERSVPPVIYLGTTEQDQLPLAITMIFATWLAVWLGSFLYWGLTIEARNPRVAVCIQGQIRRWLPQFILPNLIESNPDIDLVFFVNLQYPTKSQGSHYSTLSHLTLSPSNVSQATFESSLSQVHEQWTTNHSSIGQIAFHNPYSREYFQEKFQTTRLAVIEQYEAVQHLILNMYSHQERCIAQLQEYEINVFQNKYNSTVESSASNTSKHFDYVLSLREDIYFFRPLVLRTVIDQYLLNPRGTALQDSVGRGQKRDVGCHIVQKNCLRWSGLNMRGQLLSREHALAFLGQRLSYYNQGVQTHQEILNPEGWELKQLHDLHLHACDVPVDLFPITVARNLPGGKHCFIPFEIMHKCIPRGMHQEINALDCQKVLRETSNSNKGKM